MLFSITRSAIFCRLSPESEALSRVSSDFHGWRCFPAGFSYFFYFSIRNTIFAETNYCKLSISVLFNITLVLFSIATGTIFREYTLKLPNLKVFPHGFFQFMDFFYKKLLLLHRKLNFP